MAFIDTGGVRLHYEVVGSGSKHVLFLHGNLGSVSWFELAWNHISPNIAAVAVDFRGCGLSDKPEPTASYENYSISQLADDVLEVMNRLRIPRADIVAHSTGALVAFHMRFKKPDAVGKILAIDPASPMGVDLSDRMHIFQGARNDRVKARRLLSTMMASLFAPEQFDEGPSFDSGATPSQRALFNKLDAERHTASDGVWFGFARALTAEARDQPLRSRLAEIDNPVLVVWGDRDVWIAKEDLERMAQEIPDCSIEVLEGIGQTVMVEDPELFAALVNDFILDESDVTSGGLES